MSAIVNRRRYMGKKDVFDVVRVIPKIIPNTFIDKHSGYELPYNGWYSTDFIPLTGFSFYGCVLRDLNYSAFYDASKNKIGKPYRNGDIPVNAKYVRFSSNVASVYSEFLLAKNKMVANVYESNKYIETNGVIKKYDSWSVYKFAILNEAYVFTSAFNNYMASYNSDNSVFDSGKVFLHKPMDGYVLASRDTTDRIAFYYGYNYGVIDYSQQ